MAQTSAAFNVLVPLVNWQQAGAQPGWATGKAPICPRTVTNSYLACQQRAAGEGTGVSGDVDATAEQLGKASWG